MTEKNFRDDKSRIPTEAELEAMLDQESDDEFGQTEFQVASEDHRAVLKEWTAQDFANIYTRFRPHLERHARRFLRNPSQVDEVVQDAFLYLMVTLPELDSELGVLRFLKWKVRLLCLDVIRAGSKAYVADLEEHQDSLASDDEEISLDLERAEEAAIVRMALAKLQPRHREVLIASIYEEKSTLEIADQVGLSENATRQLMHRARGALKKALVGEADTAGMNLGQILSVAARKAAHDAKNAGVQAMSILTIAVLGIAAFLNFGSFAPTAEVAEAPAVQTAQPQPSETSAPIETPAETENQAPATTEEPAIETETVVEAEVATTEESAPEIETVAFDEPAATSSAVQVVLTDVDPLIDESPFDPWLVDSMILGGFSNTTLFSPQPTSNNYQLLTAVSDVNVWADVLFNSNASKPFDTVRLGFVIQGQQYSAAPRQLDLVVTRMTDGTELFTYVGQIGDIADLQGTTWSRSRMDGVIVTLRVTVQTSTASVIGVELGLDSELS